MRMAGKKMVSKTQMNDSSALGGEGGVGRRLLRRLLGCGGAQGAGNQVGQATGFEALEGRQMLAADLALSLGKVSVSRATATESSVVTIPTTLKNVGNQTFSGSGTVSFYLSRNGAVDESDTLLGQLSVGESNINRNMSQTLSFQTGLPNAADLGIAAGAYSVVARFTPTLVESETAGRNNDALSSTKLTLAARSTGGGGGGGSEANTNLSPSDIQLTLGRVQTVTDKFYRAPAVLVDASLKNVGSTVFTGSGTVRFYLSNDSIVDGADTVIGDVRYEAGRITKNQTKKVTLRTLLPQWVDPAPGQTAVDPGTYTVVARFIPDDASSETAGTNNEAAASGAVTVSNQFGFLTGARKGTTLVQVLSDGSTIEIGLSRFSQGSISSQGGRIVLDISGSDPKSALVITAVKGTPTINEINVSGSLARITLKGTGFRGDLTINGTVGEIVLPTVTNSTIIINNFSTLNLLSAGQMINTSIVVSGDVKVMSVESWTDTDNNVDLLQARTIARLKVGSSGLGVNVTLTGNGINSTAGTQWEFNGPLTGGKWDITGQMSSIRVNKGGVSDQWRARFLGDVLTYEVRNAGFAGTMSARNFNIVRVDRDVVNAKILAGTNLGKDARLGGTGDDADGFFDGTLNTVDFRANVINSTIATSVDPVNGVYNDADDVFVADARGLIRSITVGRGITNSFFISKTLPTTAKVAGQTVNTATNAAFVGVLPRV